MKIYTPPKITLRPEMLREAKRVSELLKNHSSNDIEIWCDLLGFRYIRDDGFFVRAPVKCFVSESDIYIHKDLNRNDTIKAIAHEYCHSKYHGDVVQYAEVHKFDSGRNEGQAIAFAEAVLNH